MTIIILLLLMLVFSLRSLLGWRTAMFLMIVVAAIQDPLRKLTPGTPSWMALATAPIFIAMVFASIMTTKKWWSDFSRSFPPVANWLMLLMLLSLPGAVQSATYGEGSWQLTVIGIFSYSIIFLGLISGFHYARNLLDVRKLLVFYCLVNGVMLTGGVFEYLEWFPDWIVLGDKALGYHWIRWEPGYIVNPIAGFYRSGDVMGWHAAAVCTISVILGMTGPRSRRPFWLLLSCLAIVALLLCGRRKMVYMLPVFGLALGWIYLQSGRHARVWAVAGLLALPAASVWVVSDWLGESSGPIRYYTQTSDQTLDSFQLHGFRSMYDTYDQSGFLGAGLGTATPGSHNLKVERPRTWQESTTSRILVELGVPGTIGFVGVMVAIVLALWKVTRRQLRERRPHAQYVAGLVAFFIANVGSLTVSGQILADPFIASYLGFLVGIALSFARPQFQPTPTAVREQPVGRPRDPRAGLAGLRGS